MQSNGAHAHNSCMNCLIRTFLMWLRMKAIIYGFARKIVPSVKKLVALEILAVVRLHSLCLPAGEDSPEGQAEGPLPRRPPRNRPYACTFCPKKFPKQGKLLKHLDLHKKHLFQCDVCFILFPSQEQLDKHKPSHICSTCGAVCFSRNKLRAHRREAHGTPYECQKCGKGFMDRRTRNRHQQSCVV